MPRSSARPTAVPRRAVALLVALALAGCGGAPATTAPPAALGVATPVPTPPGGAGRVPPATPPVGTAADAAADRAAQLAAAGGVLPPHGDVAAGRPAPADLRPEVLADLRLLIDRGDGGLRRCLVEFTVVGAPRWTAAPVAFVPLLDADGAVVAGARDAGVRLTTSGLEGYATIVSFQSSLGDPATPTSLPPGSPCAPAAPATPYQVARDRHRALRGEALAVLVEFRDGAWAATEARAAGTGLP